MNECRFRIQYVNRSDSARIGESEPTRRRSATIEPKVAESRRKSPKRKIPKVRELTNYGNCSFDELAGGRMIRYWIAIAIDNPSD